jgi:hypothetical protein
VPASTVARVSHLPPVSVLFAAFLGYNPIQHLLGTQVLAHLPASNAATLTGQQFFPHLISAPFHHGLIVVFTLAIVMSLLGAATSFIRPTRKSVAAAAAASQASLEASDAQAAADGPVDAELVAATELVAMSELGGAAPLAPSGSSSAPDSRSVQ